MKRSVIAVAGSIAVSIGIASASLAGAAHAASSSGGLAAGAAQQTIGMLTLVSPVTGGVAAQVHLRLDPQQLIIPQSGSTAFVTGFAAGHPVAYKITPAQPVRVLRIANSRSSIALGITPNGRTVYLSEPENPLGGQPLAKIVPISTRTGRSAKPIDVRGLGSEVTSLSVEPNNKVMYVAAAEPATVEAVRLSTRKVIGRPIRLARTAGFFGVPEMTYSLSGSRLYVLYSLGSTRYSLLTVINTRTGRKIGTVRVQGLYVTNTEDLAVTPRGGFAYVLTMESRPNEVLDPVSVLHIGAKVSTVRTLTISGASAVAEAPSGRAAYVAGADYGAQEVGQVTRIPTATNKAASPVTVAADTPLAISISPDSRNAYVEEANGQIYPVNLTTDAVGVPIGIGSQPDYFAGNGGLAFSHSGTILYALGTTTG